MTRRTGEKGPFRIDGLTDFPPVVRAFECPYYDDCLWIADEWESFTCSGCFLLKDQRRLVVSMSDDETLERKVPLRSFINRIKQDPIARGFSEKNFKDKIYEDTRVYYGEPSPELLFVQVQLRILEIIVDERGDDISPLLVESARLQSVLGTPSDLYSIYLGLCGKSWNK